ncbi:hypothetical protein LGQ02_14725 [Bacillus shivajii]|uniref:hypothetical protein n=1 Tax=Bacillus shivajii TaxID=1983719 RepID=UPI001CFBDCFE|nr:hypothetical protein [Bacillus shivajii]UCZ52093.1 hypothetical protein LGQ02_14725 [Bacillus shivajii]
MMTNQRKILYGSIGAVFLLLLVAFTYFLYLSPKIDERNRAISNVSQEQELVSQLEETQREEARERQRQTGQSTDLQRRLPVVPLTDQFLLDLNRAEELANVRMMELVLTNDQPVHEVIVMSSPERIGDPDGEEEETREARGLTAQLESYLEPETEGEGVAWIGDVIDGLYKQQANIIVKVDTYDHLIRFLDELDSLVRLLNIEEVHFSREDMSDDMIVDGEDALFYQVIASSYYYPPLTDLEHEAPRVDYPPMEGRDQPFTD